MPNHAYLASSSSEDEVAAYSSLAYSALKKNSTKVTEQPKGRQQKRKRREQDTDDHQLLRSSLRQLDTKKNDSKDEDIAPVIGELAPSNEKI